MQKQPNKTPWEYYSKHNDYLQFALDNGAPKPTPFPQVSRAKVDIDPQSFIDYIVANEHSCQQKWFHPRDFLSEEANIEMAFPVTVGLHQGNTFEYNWGLYDNTSNEILELIGEEALTAIGYELGTVFARLIVYMPGHGIPWHRDTMDGWKEKYPQYANRIVERNLLMVSEWHWGQLLQIDNNVFTHWNSGDVYVIPTKHWHLSANQGVVPKITVSLTGVLA